MKLFEGKPKSEQYKMIAAAVLGAIALFSLVFLFFGDSFSSGGNSANRNSNKNKDKNSSSSSITQRITQTQTDTVETNTIAYGPIVYSETTPPSVVAGRNIFDIYVPIKVESPVIIPTPPPTPPPPLTLTSISPANVYARTPDNFTLQVTGDKFTPDSRISFDNNDLPTRFISPQQLSATVPASFITNDGARVIKVRTPDGTLYSNEGRLNVMAPPQPNYLYVGLIGDKYYNKDVAILRDKTNAKNLFGVKRGEEVGERFRVVSISEAEIVLIDKQLKVKHQLTMSTDKTASSTVPGFGNNPSLQPYNNRAYPQGEIPGIPGNIPRYQPPKKTDDDDDDDDDPNQ